MLKIGLLKEVKANEWRVMLTPEGVKVLVKNGLEIYVEQNAGEACRFSDLEYEQAGARLLPTMEKVMERCEILLQVQPPQPVQFELLNQSHTMISFLNLFHQSERLNSILETGASFISAELIQDETGNYPLLSGMSEVAGKMAINQAALLLTTPLGGKGKLLARATNAKPAKVTVVGAGMVGRTVTEAALSAGAEVNLASLKPQKLPDLHRQFPEANVENYSDELMHKWLPETDVLVVAVYSLRRKYDIRITREMVHLMEKGSVVIDISVVQADIVETSHITTHEQSSFILDGIVHYGVPNIAAIVPLTASRILTKKIIPYLKVLALKGFKNALVEEPGLIAALSIYKGKLTNRNAADYFNREFYSIFELLELNL